MTEHVIPPPADYFIRYESGQMDESEMLEFFQWLVDSGLAWSLQGSYGRMAANLLQSGAIQPYPRKT